MMTWTLETGRYTLTTNSWLSDCEGTWCRNERNYRLNGRTETNDTQLCDDEPPNSSESDGPPSFTITHERSIAYLGTVVVVLCNFSKPSASFEENSVARDRRFWEGLANDHVLLHSCYLTSPQLFQSATIALASYNEYRSLQRCRKLIPI